MNKPIIFSGVQPSGNLHIGNYLGALSQWVELQDKYKCIFCVVDYHAITVNQNPNDLRKRIVDIAKIYIASGIDPEKSIIFKQSDISAHTELAWILNCTAARISDLNKMTQFKDKADKNQENVSVGLYDYPVLMAADILLYNTDLVPVGEDQTQHVELARAIARRFNKRFGETLKVPELKIRKSGARIMGLDDPTKKMSKSANSEGNYIALLDSPKNAEKKIMRATTDSGNEIKFDIKEKPGISNLITIYGILSSLSHREIELKYKSKGYGDFKKDLAKVVSDFLIGFQKKYNALDDKKIENILKGGAIELEPIANKTLENVKTKIGSI